MRCARSLPALVASLLAAPALAHAQSPAEAGPVVDPTSMSATSASATGPASASPEVAPGPSASPAPASEVAAAPAVTPLPPGPAPTSTPTSTLTGPAAHAPPEISPPRPRLQLSVGAVFGPHALGEADCQSNDGISECQHRGNFLGAGATIELRAQLFKFLYMHARGVVVGNIRKRPYAVHSGLGGGGLGLGLYSRQAFIRGEYMLIPTFGPDTYVPPFFDKQVARDRYGFHAGMISGGIHKYVSPRTALELWAGMVIGPSSRRTSLSEQVAEKRVLITFMVSVGVLFDLVLAKGHVPPPKQPPRKRRVW